MISDPSCKTFLDSLPQDRAENHFQESKPLMTDPEARLEASRCLFCFEAPCITACPTAINIPQFIQRISSGNLRGAARTILSANALGLSCAAACPTEVLCESACVHIKLTQKSVQIGRLQRFAVEMIYKTKTQLFTCAPPTKKRVALIGSGPASLSCARDLRLNGHETVIFEKSEIPGGLNTTAIAPYKMKSDASLREIETIAALGVQFEFGKELGKNLTIQELLDNFDAIFVGIGLGDERSLQFQGADLPGVTDSLKNRMMGAVQFISKLKSTALVNIQELNNLTSVLVVGGGNTALDVARELKQLKVPSVTVSYRRTEAEMPGYKHEFLAARREGVQFLFQTTPTQIEPIANGNSLLVTLTSKNSGTAPHSETSLSIQADLVLFAIGHLPQAALFSEVPEILFKNGKLIVNPESGQTGHPRIFAGGDITNGGKEVVHAVQAGKIAALSIHKAMHAEVLNHG